MDERMLSSPVKDATKQYVGKIIKRRNTMDKILFHQVTGIAMRAQVFKSSCYLAIFKPSSSCYLD
jgi:hypothetical protein